MRTLALAVLRSAAVAAGLPDGAVLHIPAKDGPTLPARRMEISYLPEQYQRTGRPLCKTATPEGRSRTLRREVHQIRLTVRAALRADNEAWLRTFSRAFVRALPKNVVDEDGNTVAVRVDKAEYGGFTARLVEVFVKRSKTFHITFTGRTTRVLDIPLIRDVNINPTYREENHGQE